MTTTASQAPTSTITQRIEQAIKTTKPGPERTKALKAIRWVLQTEDGQFARLNGLSCILTEFVELAQTFDGRHNEELKARFWSAQLGVKVVATIL